MHARIDPSACPVPRWLAGGHVQTLYSALLAQHPRIAFVRERVDTPDGDFIDVDWTAPDVFAQRVDGKLVKLDAALAATAAHRWMHAQDWTALAHGSARQALILFHGLEGSSRSHYAQTIAQYFRARGWIVAVAHFRGCSGAPNRMARAYHAGESAEIAFMLEHARQRAPHVQWHALGVSLGGNALLKTLGEQGEAAHWLASCAAISAPTDLVTCGHALSDTWAGRHLYSRYFLRSMRQKLLEKSRRFPGTIDVLRLAQLKTLRDFDDYYTAPMHGYRDVLDYWTQASSLPVLRGIVVPTLVLNARDDPFVPAPCLPGSRDASAHVLLHQPARGGHVGFVTGGFPGDLHWLPQRVARFFEAQC